MSNAQHYGATATRTLCGRAYGPRVRTVPLWPDFLHLYRTDRSECCERCLTAARKWQRFSRDLAMVNEEQRRERERSG